MSSTTTTSSAAAIAAAAEAAAKRLAADPLGYDVYATTLWQRIHDALDHDALTGNLGDDPLVVGIFGEWGAGKSYLLNKIYQQAKVHQHTVALRRRGDGGFTLTIPVAFQPWKYEHEAHLHVPLLLHILAELDEGLKDARTFWEGVSDAAQTPGDAVIQALPTLVSWVKKALAGAAGALEPVSAVAFTSASGLADHAVADAAQRKKLAKAKVADRLKYTEDGRYFHEIHKVFKAVCRPGKYPDLHGRVLLTEGFKTNFVVFVDDLDRCLPEKAVAVLELIKTVFNVESFAFVLALDDEVIERGIGHRYKEYALLNKKPQMPITGFEYLEKIVHLPFRLPALTRSQAIAFVRVTEKRVEPNAALHWFGENSAVGAAAIGGSTFDVGGRSEKLGVSGMAGRSSSRVGLVNGEPPLLDLLLSSFDALVPRKLLRAVELWHQICRVARVRGVAEKTATASAWRRIQEGSAVTIDTRVVFALALLQLFQPELFRFMRRRSEAFSVLLRALATSTVATDGLNKIECSDVDLWSWASFRVGEADPKRIKRPQTEQAAVALIASLPSENAYQAQHIRLRLAERLVEHFAVQRHVFNPLRLMHWLAGKLDSTEVKQFSNLPAYFGVLAQQSELAIVEKPPTQGISPEGIASGEVMAAVLITRPMHPGFSVAEIDGLFDVLVATDTAARSGIQARFSLPSKQVLDCASAIALQRKFSTHFATSNDPRDIVREKSFDHAVGALGAIAPWLDWSAARPVMLTLMGPATAAEPTTAESDGALVDRFIGESQSAQTRNAIGDLLERFPSGDPRFADAAPYFLQDAFPPNAANEPIPGFVRIPAGKFRMGHEKESDNTPRDAHITSDFYISRTLTTVAQYGRFIDAGGYTLGADIWGTQGLSWRSGTFDSAVENADYKKWLARRTVALRLQPWDWTSQLAHPSRPVTGVTWFEARAYARWLDGQITTEQRALLGSSRYEVCLPTEDQWERAARASRLTASHSERWPWGDEEAIATQRANVSGSGIDHVSSVGVFAPNAIGLYDMAGNAWQWMDNLYSPSSVNTFPRVEIGREFKTHKDLVKSERPALRGGSWVNYPELASCSFRNRILPDFSFYYIRLAGSVVPG